MSDAGSEDDDGNNNGGNNGNGINSDSLDRLLKAAANQRRRTVLYALEDIDDDVISLNDLADEIAPQDSHFDDSQRVRLVLHHRDLPKLAELGQLDYDSRQGTIRYHRDDAVEDFLEYLKELEE